MALRTNLPVALHCVPVPEFGGVARHLSDIAEAGLPGYRLVVLCPAGALSQRLWELGVEVREAEFGTGSGFSSSFKVLNSAIDELKPAVVHTHLAYADVVGAVAVGLRRMMKLVKPSTIRPKLFTTEHGIAGDDKVYHGTSWRSRVMETVHRVRLWATDGKIAVSQSTADQMRLKWGARGVEVIYNGVNVDEVAAKVAQHRVEGAADGLRILSLSRLAPEKGIDLLIEAFKEIQGQVPGARLEIAGSGELREELGQQVASLGLSELVSFPGFVNPLEAMGRSDILVQLSVWENCSYTLLDAKAAQLSVVATAVGGNPEILEGSELVEPLAQMERREAVATIASAILAQQSRKAEAFRWLSTSDMGKNLVDLYQREK